jgi:hypothetical protein
MQRTLVSPAVTQPQPSDKRLLATACKQQPTPPQDSSDSHEAGSITAPSPVLITEEVDTLPIHSRSEENYFIVNDPCAQSTATVPPPKATGFIGMLAAPEGDTQAPTERARAGLPLLDNAEAAPTRETAQAHLPMEELVQPTAKSPPPVANPPEAVLALQPFLQ